MSYRDKRKPFFRYCRLHPVNRERFVHIPDAMYDGSDPLLEDNLKTAVPLLDLCRDNEIILEVETGVVGEEEDGLNRE